jgi:hypothetical protein
VPVPCFLLFLCFRKITQEIFSELDEIKAEHPEIYRSFQKSEEEMEGGHWAASPPGGAAYPWPAPTCGEGHLAQLWRRLFAYKDPRREKPKARINFPETHRDSPPSSTRDREGPEALPGTLPERGIATIGLLHRHACLRRDE